MLKGLLDCQVSPQMPIKQMIKRLHVIVKLFLSVSTVQNAFTSVLIPLSQHSYDIGENVRLYLHFIAKKAE